MSNILYDPVQEAVLQRRNMQSNKVKEQLNKLYDIDFNKQQLNVIKRKRPGLSRGDIFVLNPFDDIYFYGLVLNADIDVRPLGKNLVTVCILKKYTHGINETFEISRITETDILLTPRIISKAYWINGYFYNIGRTLEDGFTLDYGFYDIGEKCYLDEYGTISEQTPALINGFGITTMTGIVRLLYYELLIDNSFMSEADSKLFFKHFEEAVNYAPPERELSEFDKKITPFEFKEENKRRYSVNLTEFDKFDDLLAYRSSESEGNGYDWEDLVKCFIKSKFPGYKKKIHFDSEANMFYMYCSDENMLKAIIKELSDEIKRSKLKDYI